MISSNYFSEKNVSGEIIAKVLTGTMIQHYLSYLVSFINTIHMPYKDFNCILGYCREDSGRNCRVLTKGWKLEATVYHAK